jgi:hypothetical protein
MSLAAQQLADLERLAEQVRSLLHGSACCIKI